MPDDNPDFGSGFKDSIDRKLDEFGLTQTDYVKAALNWQYNWIGLAGAAAFALVAGSGLPLVLAAGVELMYVAMVPQSSRFRRLVRSWKYAAEKKAHERRLQDMFRDLPEPMRSRYSHIQDVVQGIRGNYARLSSTSQMFSKQMEEKLGGLLHGYIRLLHAAHTHAEYLKSLFPESVRREIEQIEKTLDKDPAKVREINTRRIDILKKRLAKFEKIRENRKVIDAQCSAIEDVLQLIRDQSVTMRDPQELSAQLDTLVSDVEQTEENVREMEAIFALAAPDSNTETGMPVLDEPARPRNRVRN